MDSLKGDCLGFRERVKNVI